MSGYTTQDKNDFSEEKKNAKNENPKRALYNDRDNKNP